MIEAIKRRTSAMSDELKRRWTAAAVVVAVVLITVVLLGPAAVFILGLLLGLGGWREYARLTGLNKKPSIELLGYGWVLISFTFSYFVGPRSLIWFWMAPLSAFLVIAIEHFMVVYNVEGIVEETPENAWKIIQDFTVGSIYIFMIFGFVGPIAMRDQGQELLLMGIASVALADTAAYFGGRRWGKRKLWPAFSPGKTIEGAYCSFGGSLFGALLIWVIYFLADRSMALRPEAALAIGVVAAPLGILGDLYESLLKRVSGQKDSGHLIPGHGGILDRADAFVFVFPLIYFLF
ncbi:MAG: phosphatidate cytidylyltransferase [Bdellovibrionota bacterium]